MSHLGMYTQLALIFGLTAAEILAVAGLISAVGGFITTIMAAHRATRSAQDECEDKLRYLRRECNDLADRLYQYEAKP